MKNSANPVGLAQPPTSPKRPGRDVNSHSAVVKFFALTTGSLTTIVAIGADYLQCGVWAQDCRSIFTTHARQVGEQVGNRKKRQNRVRGEWQGEQDQLRFN